MPKDTSQLPRRFHIGTQKAASTFLYNLLESHPETTMGKNTKVLFFSDHYGEGKERYKSMFPSGKYKIDTSPNYFIHSPQVPKRINEFYENPEALRFILVLRNPINYISSYFRMNKVAGGFKDKSSPPKNLRECYEAYPEYFEKAKYAKLLDRWLKFFDRKQFSIFIFEEFVSNTDEITEEMLNFWGIPKSGVELTVGEVSKNKALKYSWMYSLQREITDNHSWLKRQIKTSPVANWVIDTFFTTSTSDRISNDGRDMLQKIFSDDVQRLKSDHGISISRWEDFSS